MKSERLFWLLVSLCLALAMVSLVVGCAAPAPSPTSPPTSKPASTPTATAKPTTTAAPTATSTPAATPKPTTTPTSAPASKVSLRIASDMAGSTTFVVAAAISRMVAQYAPSISLDTMGISGEAKTKMLGTKEVDMAFSELITAYQAANGLGGYAGNKLPVRVVMVGQESVWQWFSLNPKVQTLADFKGRAIEYLQTGTASKENLYNGTFEWLYNTYGFSQRDVRALEYTGAAKATEDLISGVADVTDTFAKAGSALLQLATQYPDRFHIIPYPDAAVEYVLKNYPGYYKTTVPAGTYGKYPLADIQTMGSPNVCTARADLSDDAVYQVVKAVFDHLPEFQSLLAKSVAPDFSLKNAVARTTAPFHAGAIKYYKEKGVWTAEHDKQQAANLAAIGATR